MTANSDPESNYDQRHQQVDHQVNVAVDYHAGDEAYDVAGLKNPYLGLQAFTYEHRAIYAGRDQGIAAAVRLLTTPGAERALLFITGASGSGKSSFAQAGLLPALEKHYLAQNYAVAKAIFRPGEQPLAALAGALRTLHIPAEGFFAPAAEYQLAPPQDPAGPDQISILVIDQFEELFSQSEPAQREAIFSLLVELPPFRENRLHVIATMRADYLPDLFGYKTLYEIAKAGMDLRAMDEAELKAAIRRPLQQTYPDAGKCFQQALLSQLAADAAEDAAYLPLLQVTLEDLWDNRLLTVDHYDSLANAISRRAEEIYRTRRNPDGTSSPRSAKEQETLLNAFLDLVDVPLEDNVHREILHTRPLHDVTRGRREVESLVQELVTARLLTTDQKPLSSSGQEIESLDIVHDSLIINWPRLRKAIREQSEQLRQRRRFEQRLAEWVENHRSKAFLLRGVHLAEAENLQKQDIVSVQPDDAKNFINQSIQERDRARRRTIIFLATAIGTLLVLLLIANQNAQEANRQASVAQTAEAEATHSLATAVAAKSTAQADAQRARSGQLAGFARNELLSGEPDYSRALMLALEAVYTTFDHGGPVDPDVQRSLRQVIAAAPPLMKTFPSSGHSKKINGATISPSGDRAVTTSADGTARILDINSGEEVAVLSLDGASIFSAFFSPDRNRIATVGSGAVVSVWDADTGSELVMLKHSVAPPVPAPKLIPSRFTRSDSTLTTYSTVVRGVDWSPDADKIATAGSDGRCRIWDAATGEEIGILEHEHDLQSATFNFDASKVATVSQDGTVLVWDVLTLEKLHTLSHDESILDASFSPDGTMMVTISEDQSMQIWNMASGEKLFTLSSDNGIANASFSPDGKTVFTSSSDHTAHVWDATSGEEVATLAHKATVVGASFSPSGEKMLTVGEDETVRIWDVKSGEQLASWMHPSSVISISFSPDGEKVVTITNEGAAHFWDAITGASLSKSIGLWCDGDLAGISRDETRILMVNNDGRACVRSLGNREVASTIIQIDAVRSASFSPDGDKVVTVSEDRTTRVWDAASGEGIATLMHDDVVLAASFSPNGDKIITASEDHTARIWNVGSGEEIATLMHDDVVLAASFSPEGEKVVTASEDHTARVWNAASGEEIATLMHDDVVSSATFNYDGSVVLTVSRDWRSHLWYVSSEEKILEFLATVDVQFSDSGDKMLAVDNEGLHTSMDSKSYEANYTILEDWPANSFLKEFRVYSEDGAMVLVTLGDRRTVRVWDTLDGTMRANLVHDEDVHSASFSADGSSIITVDQKNIVRFWGVNMSWARYIWNHNDVVLSASFSPGGDKVVTASEDHTARVWDAVSGEAAATLRHDNVVLSASFSPDGDRVVTVSLDHTARIWDAVSGEGIATLGHEDAVLAATFSPDGDKIVTASEDHTARVWDAISGEEITILRHEDVVLATAFSPEGDTIVTGSQDYSVRKWDSASGDIISTIDPGEGFAPVHSIAFSPDGTKVAMMMDTNRFEIWDLTNGSLRSFIPSAWITSVDYSPDGTTVTTTGSPDRATPVTTGPVDLASIWQNALHNWENAARIWDLTSGEVLAYLEHNDNVTSAKFSADGKMVVTTSLDGTARIWDTASTTVQAVLTHDDGILLAVFSPDGTKVVTSGLDRTSRLWINDLSALMFMAENRIQRPSPVLTLSERQRFNIPYRIYSATSGTTSSLQQFPIPAPVSVTLSTPSPTTKHNSRESTPIPTLTPSPIGISPAIISLLDTPEISPLITPIPSP